MRHSLRAHISYLETTIQSVRDRLRKPSLDPDEIEDLELQLTLAQSALEHYRQAYTLELSVSGPEPPDRPIAEPKEGAGNGDSVIGQRKKEGLVVVARRRTRKKARGGLLYPSAASVNRKCA